MSRRSGEDFIRGVSLSQKLSYHDKDYRLISGSDPAISNAIGVLTVLLRKKVIEKTPEVELLLAILDMKRKVSFATSEQTNEITKMGLNLPEEDDVVHDVR